MGESAGRGRAGGLEQSEKDKGEPDHAASPLEQDE